MRTRAFLARSELGGPSSEETGMLDRIWKAYSRSERRGTGSRPDSKHSEAAASGGGSGGSTNVDRIAGSDLERFRPRSPGIPVTPAGGSGRP